VTHIIAALYCRESMRRLYKSLASRRANIFGAIYRLPLPENTPRIAQ